ncbi:UDP-N-acetylglucosamine 1-carboxyvinyltransferase [Dolosicoccus paucivorans]|uniref:UDP-N-acetylglucosamine 1-carboxyvinyltransferase n=1 Tax=Dolosicoccus paucivorans TaxID=84521 RepID=A0A2N6SP76_9LACT|nr:UDP-N-acetylglucosamine 1-carboxyvinyltransferase [Dolosicoccus paucivorans]PMB84879.1 UDP-N-acetylglucosamine 1-carboxyvinyltransferase [Dolosicoccus paucivorans]PMC58875.1 UDP-N-acetylglucosamine 1-carboxyvinyltransferase [Dolosicoccus paucivorans]
MEEIIVQGGRQLEGVVKVEGAKNAVLPILAATILAEEGQVELTNVPVLSDVETLNELLNTIQVKTVFDQYENTLTVDATGDVLTIADYDFVSKMRASIVVMGPLLARFGHAKVAMPGGCAIGSRPIDLHLKGFEALGATITRADGYVEAKADKLVGTKIYLDFPSVGATENIMMAAVLAEGTTILENVAREPEIVDLANLLNRMGAQVIGAGTETIKITGVDRLHGAKHHVISDRIEAGTFMVAAAITQGDVLVEGAIAEHNRPLISKLREMGVTIDEYDQGVRVRGPKELKPTDIKTLPYPGFPTDMQAQVTIAQLLANGTSSLTETVFENRFMHFDELRRMGADFTTERQTVLMYGPAKLSGARVKATDLRAAAALILAGLRAEGITRVSELVYLDRGYYRFHQKLKALGANIKREKTEEVE